MFGLAIEDGKDNLQNNLLVMDEEPRPLVDRAVSLRARLEFKASNPPNLNQ